MFEIYTSDSSHWMPHSMLYIISNMNAYKLLLITLYQCLVPLFQLWYFVFLILISNFCAICCNYTCQLHFLDFTSNKTKLHQILSQRRCIANASCTTQRHPLQNIPYYTPNILCILIIDVLIVLVALLAYSIIVKTALYYPIFIYFYLFILSFTTTHIHIYNMKQWSQVCAKSGGWRSDVKPWCSLLWSAEKKWCNIDYSWYNW